MIFKDPRIAVATATVALAAVITGTALFVVNNNDRSASSNAPSAVDHANVITTVFWAGEPGDSDNGNIPNAASAWDEHWQAHYGGVDDPAQRRGYQPAAFTPAENPFYVALPYNDIDSRGTRKPTSDSCRDWQPAQDPRYSYCKNIWVAITRGGKTAYAQWEDVGPFQENDFAYVFGTKPPVNTQGEHAGLDVSPAVRDALGMQDVDRTGWHFVQASQVPDGPWKTVVTTSHGEAL